MKYNGPYGGSDPNASYINGNPAAGIQGSIPPAAAFEEHQRELVQLLTSAGTTPSSNDLMQVIRAIRSQKINSAIATNTTGDPNTIVMTFDPPMMEPIKLGHVVRFLAVQSTTGAVTLVTDTLTHPLIRADGMPLGNGDILTGQIVEALYDGNSKWQITNFRGNYTVSGTPAIVVAHDRADGQCYLTLSGGNLLLKPYNGNRLIINDILTPLPAAGISLPPTGLTPSTMYYIYAALVGGVPTLEASTATHVTEAVNSTEVKTGDPTRRFVGMAYVIGGPSFADNFVASWFNRKIKSVQGHWTSSPSTSSTVLVELDQSIRTQFICFGDEDVEFSCSGECLNISNSFCGVVSALAVDGVVQDSMTAFAFSPTAGSGQPLCMSGSKRLLEGQHYATVFGDAQMQNGLPTTANWSGGPGPANDHAATYITVRFRG